MEVIKKDNKKNIKANKMLYYIGIIIIFLIIVLVAYSIISSYLNYINIVSITQPTSLTLSANPVVISLNGNEYTLRLLSYSSATSVGVLSITKLPIFVNPTMLVKVPLNNFTDVNLSSKYATLEIKLASVNNNYSVIDLIPVPESLFQAPTSQRISFVNNTVPSLSSQTKSINLSNSISANVRNTTNTTKTNPTNKTSNTSSSTSAYSTNYTKAMALLEKSAYYPVMVDYTKIYANESKCNQSNYTSLYKGFYGSVPTGPDTYQNITKLVPYKLSFNLTNVTPSMFKATYTTYSYSNYTNGTALVIMINVSKNAIVSSMTENAFDFMNATSLTTAYNKANRIGNCGILICSTSKGC
ncbi:MAG: hypothetical protein ACP5RI_02100 [Candidatus Micrarchaeia archaeon]